MTGMSGWEAGPVQPAASREISRARAEPGVSAGPFVCRAAVSSPSSRANDHCRYYLLLIKKPANNNFLIFALRRYLEWEQKTT